MTAPGAAPTMPGTGPDALSRRGATLALGGAWLAFFLPHLVSGGVPFYRDQLVTLLPVRAWVRERLLAGELPEWFPHEALGMPLAGQLVSQTFHPLTWLLLPFEPATGLKLAMLVAWALGLAGAYRLARASPVPREAAVVAAVAFAFGGYALGQASNAVYALAHGTAPWALVVVQRLRRRQRVEELAMLALVFALVLLAGDVQGFGLCVGLGGALLWGAPRRAWGAYAAGVLLALALAAPEFLPSLVVSGESSRRAGEGSERFGREWAFSAWRLPELVVGGFVPDLVRNLVAKELLGEPRNGLWSTTLTMGASVLACLLAGLPGAWRRHALLVVGLGVAFWLSLGEAGGLWAVAARLLPPVGWFRYPEKYLSAVWVAGIVPTALGAAVLLDAGRRLLGAVAGAGGLLLALGAAAGRPGLLAPLLGERSAALTDPGVVRELSAAWERGLLVAGAALLVLALARVAAARVPLLLAAVAFGELWLANGHHFPLVDPGVLAEANPFADAAKASAPSGGRVVRAVNIAPVAISLGVTLDTHEAWVRATRRALVASTASLDGVAGFKPNLALVPLRLRHLQQRLREVPGALGQAGVCFATLGLGPPAPAQELAVDAEHGLRLARLPCEPRAAWVAAEPAVDRDAALRALAPGRRVTSWEGLDAAVPLAEGPVTWRRDDPEHVELEVASAGGGALVLRDLLFRGWSAEVDGAPARLQAVDGALRGLLVPPGRHVLTFRYAAPGLRAGLGLAWAALAGLAVAFAWSRRRRGSSVTGDVVARVDG
jgi:hypothetical protein